MILWFNDKDLSINFSTEPCVSIRYIMPSMSMEEKCSVKKYPFINKISLNVNLIDKRNNKSYSFTIPKCYCFDGASVPRFFWRVIGSNTDNKFLIAAMVHDFMCENHSLIGNDREFSSKVFDSLLKVSQVGGFKRFLMKSSVDLFQKWFCKW